MSGFTNPGAAGQLSAIARFAAVALTPPAWHFLSRAEALTHALRDLTSLRRNAYRSGTTDSREALGKALADLDKDLSDRIEEILSRGPLPDDLPCETPDLVTVSTLNAWVLAGRNPRVPGMIRGALVFLTPPERTVALRAAAAVRAAEALHEVKRGLLKAGLADGPDCPLMARTVSLQHDIESEVFAVLAAQEIREVEGTTCLSD